MKRLPYIIMCVAFVAIGSSCSRRIVTEANTISTTTAVRVDTVRIIQRSADTIRQVQWHDHVSIIRDTVTAYHTDTVVINKSATTTTETTSARSWWDKLAEWLALIGSTALVAAVIWWRTK